MINISCFEGKSLFVSGLVFKPVLYLKFRVGQKMHGQINNACIDNIFSRKICNGKTTRPTGKLVMKNLVSQLSKGSLVYDILLCTNSPNYNIGLYNGLYIYLRSSFLPNGSMKPMFRYAYNIYSYCFYMFYDAFEVIFLKNIISSLSYINRMQCKTAFAAGTFLTERVNYICGKVNIRLV